MMLEEIIQSCYTGLGDCVVGYVSAYLLKSQLEKHYVHHPIRLSLAWVGVTCPYLNPEYLFRGHAHAHARAPVHRKQVSTINCLHSGSDGTLAFAQYYRSPRMLYDLTHVKYLRVIINQYIGKCLIDSETSREEIKQLTYQAYRFFWTRVVNVPTFLLKEPSTPPSETGVIYVRMGDQALCHGQDVRGHLEQMYQRLRPLPLPHHLILLGDVDQHVMSQVYQSIYGNAHQLIPLEGVSRHSCGRIDSDAWRIIFRDLIIMSRSRFFVSLSNSSNFPRIVLFLDPENDSRQVYFDQPDQIAPILIKDLSILFSKHYQF